MAKNTAVRLLDDLDGRAAKETVRFSLDGMRYEIDLSERNAKKLRGILRRYIDNGRRNGTRPARSIVFTSSAAKQSRVKSAGSQPEALKPSRPSKASTKKAQGVRTRNSTKKTVNAAPSRATKATKTASVKPKTTQQKATAKKTSVRKATGKKK
jgi:hypothetical protein